MPSPLMPPLTITKFGKFTVLHIYLLTYLISIGRLTYLRLFAKVSKRHSSVKTTFGQSASVIFWYALHQAMRALTCALSATVSFNLFYQIRSYAPTFSLQSIWKHLEGPVKNFVAHGVSWMDFLFDWIEIILLSLGL